MSELCQCFGDVLYIRAVITHENHEQRRLIVNLDLNGMAVSLK